jgi:hypothetical protein
VPVVVVLSLIFTPACRTAVYRFTGAADPGPP